MSFAPNFHTVLAQMGLFKRKDGGDRIEVVAQFMDPAASPRPNLRGHPLHPEGGVLHLPEPFGQARVEAREIDGQDHVRFLSDDIVFRAPKVFEDGGKVLGHFEKSHVVDGGAMGQQAHSCRLHGVTSPTHRFQRHAAVGAQRVQFLDQSRSVGVSRGLSRHEEDLQSIVLTQ